MLAGLIFAVEEAEGRPGSLMATLPFGGMTLLEYQARLLFGAGAEQVLVAVGKMTPALLAAVNRAAKRHPRIEIVRSAEEAAEKITPGAQVLVMADGLVTTDPVMDKMAATDGEALLVTDDPTSPAAIERLDMRDSWAGVARITLAQLTQIAQMPEDYDFQSALLRVAAQSGADWKS
jgi:folate-dependent tRNA-U54 methylase TrmFO/GidA